eukprot:TRINITY_DN1751_c0_g1_i1.p1 TRINITY_DN1751_c0_g1~~TRINITY_DN1751_c0_g1_i1.p1  ORF type:complete len:449 (-),score=113.57 TRINITY_DN1751_c0_g1_i1:248-1594(-)
MKGLLLSICIIAFTAQLCAGANLVSDSWIIMSNKLGVPPSPREGHTAVLNAANNTILVYGGWDGQKAVFIDVVKYLIVDDQWVLGFSPKGYYPRARYGHTAITTFDNQMIIFGGRNLTSFFNDMARYDLLTDTWISTTWAGTPPSPRFGHTAVFVPTLNQMVVFGGMDVNGNFLNDIYFFDIASSTWTTRTYNGTGPDPRAEHVAVYSPAGEMIIFGGFNGQSVRDVARFNFKTNRWLLNQIVIGSDGLYPSPRYCHTAVVGPLANMIVWGGKGDAGAPINEIWKMDLGNFTWSNPTPSAGSLDARFEHTSVATPFGTMITFGGYSETGAVVNTEGKYNLATTVLISTNDGAMEVVVMSLFGTILISMCFAVDWINEQAEKDREDAVKEALAAKAEEESESEEEEEEEEKPETTSEQHKSEFALKTQHFLHKVKENLDPMRDPNLNFT